jgi:hypothetical protein
MKMGISAKTDSFTPRKFMSTSSNTTAISAVSFQACIHSGTKGEREDRVAARGHRRGDGEDVVDEQRTAGHDTGAASEEARGHDVAAAAVRKVLDDLAVRVADDEDRQSGGEGQPDGEVAVLAERAVGFVGAVRRGREAVGAEADPREKRDERHPVEDSGVPDVLAPAEEQPGQRVGHARAK